MNKIFALSLTVMFMAVFFCGFSFAGEMKSVPVISQGSSVEQTQAQEPQETEITIIPSVKGISGNLNQDWVREYDRRVYPALDIGYFNAFWKKGNGIFRFNLIEPFSDGSDSASISWSYPSFNFEADTNGIYHRLAVFRQSRILNGSYNVIQPSPGGVFAAPYSGQANGMLLDLGSPDEKYFMYYRNTNAKVTVGNPFKTQFYASLWSDDRSGHQQLRLRDITIATNPIGEHPSNWIPYALNMRSSDLDVGLDTTVWKAAVRVSYLSSSFANNIPGIPVFVSVAPATLPSSPTVIDFPGFSGNGFRITANAPVGNKVIVHGDFLSKDRKNSFTEYSAKINYFRGGVSYRPNNDWFFSGTYRYFDSKTSTNGSYTVPFTTPGGLNDPAAARYDYNNATYQAEARYTGWKRVKIGFGYRVQKDKRGDAALMGHIVSDHNTALGRGLVDELNAPNLNNTKRLFYAHLSARPTDYLNFSLDYKNQSASKDDFTKGVPANYQRWGVDLNYTPNDRVSAYFNYFNLKENAVDFQFDNKLNSTTAGFWATPTGKWGIGGFWTKEEGDSTFNFNWAGKSGGFNIQFGPQASTYTHSSQTWGVDGMLPFGRAFRLWGKFARTLGSGSLPTTLFNNITVVNGPDANNPGILTNTITNMNPLDTKSTVFNIGLEWDLKSNSTVRLDFVKGSWVDNVNIGNNGDYSSVWASWFTKW